jgi:hypothetical protein
MSKTKIRNSLWSVLYEGIKIYISNIDKFVLYMLFPVFGQVAGLALTFGLTIGLADKVAQKANSMTTAMLYIFLLALPGLLVFIKAFWDYMVAYVALNSMTQGALTTGRVYDFQSHREVATRRAFKYIGFLMVIGLLSLSLSLCTIVPILGLIPPLIIWIYLILVYQIFTFEEDLSIKDCFTRSYDLVKGDWGRTFFLMIILAFFSIYIITIGITVIFDLFNLTSKISSIFNIVGNSLPLDYVNKALNYLHLKTITVEYISETIFTCILGTIVAGLSLPIRSICYTLWYANLSYQKDSNNGEKPKKQSKSKKNKEE